MNTYRRTVTYAIEASSLAEAEERWDEDGPEMPEHGSVESVEAGEIMARASDQYPGHPHDALVRVSDLLHEALGLAGELPSAYDVLRECLRGAQREATHGIRIARGF